MIIHKTLYQIDDIDRLNVLRKEGSGLVRIVDCLDTSVQGLEDNIRKNEEKLIYCNQIHQ